MKVVEFPRNANPQRNQNVLVPPSNLKYKSSWIKYPYRKSAIFKLSKKKLCTDLQGRSVYCDDNVILKGSVGKIYNQFKFLSLQRTVPNVKLTSLLCYLMCVVLIKKATP